MTTVTSTRETFQKSSRSLKANEAFIWFKEGWALFTKAPLKLLGLSFLFLLIPGLIQLVPGIVGMGVSKWVSALLAVALWLAVFNLATKNTLTLSGGSLRSWLNVALWSLMGPVLAWVQFQIGGALIGSELVAELLSGAMADVPVWKIGLMLASVTPINLVLLFVPPLIILKQRSILASLSSGVAAVVYAYKPMAIMGILVFLTVFLAPYTLALSALIAGPLITCMCVVAFRRLFR